MESTTRMILTEKQALAHLLTRMKRETHDPKEFDTYAQDIDSILILERGSDLVSPMCTQLTYEGLVDEMLGVNSSTSSKDLTRITH